MTPQNISSYPQRIQALRDGIIQIIPRVPNNRQSLADMQAIPTRGLILAYLTWRMRLIPAKPRKVRIWSGGVKPWELHVARHRLRPLMLKVEAGKDLTPHLSDEVNRKGVVLRKPGKPGRREDIDMILTREGLHHFHVGKHGPGNLKGRSDALVFAEVLEKEFRIVALSDHRAFERGSPEQERFFNICHSYMAKTFRPVSGSWRIRSSRRVTLPCSRYLRITAKIKCRSLTRSLMIRLMSINFIMISRLKGTASRLADRRIRY